MRNWKRNYLYRIDVLPTGEFYYGIHSTDIDEDHDRYWGSGTLIKARIRAYGKENCKKTIIDYFDTRKQLSLVEALWVQSDILSDSKCLNIIKGGSRRDEYPEEVKARLREIWHITHQPHSEETKRKMSEAHKGEKNYLYGKKHDAAWLEKVSNSCKNRIKMFDPTRNKLCWVKNEDVAQRKKEGFLEAKGSVLTSKIWIHNPETKEAIKISREEYDNYKKSGWVRGKTRDRSYLGAGRFTKSI